ncbi:MAG: methyltransferase domain-containing protein [Deltaproteobacteria bacterium]|nr:methyltransferase domain-containing protein [Deltaproteobacteria bacterium]
MNRSYEKELMDLPGAPAELLEEDLKNLRTLNRYLGAHRAVLWGLEYSIKRSGIKSFSLLDIGTGSGDLPAAIVSWAGRNGLSATVVGLEPNPTTVEVARRRTRHITEISIICGDGFNPPFRPRAFDVVLTSQVLHHFSEKEILALLQIWAGLARQGVLIGDLIRHPLAYHGVRLLTRLFTRNEMTLIDAPLSVRRSFTISEWKNLFNRTGIGHFQVFRFFPFRLFALLSVEQ